MKNSTVVTRKEKCMGGGFFICDVCACLSVFFIFHNKHVL
jgi:hypothetical protein